MDGLTMADGVTLVGYGLGLWWAQGGPSWAGLLSIACDELDGAVARARGEESARGSALDWGADVALTPMALARLAREAPTLDLFFTAPAVLALQAERRARGERPELGSVRAAVMLAAIVAHESRPVRGRR